MYFKVHSQEVSTLNNLNCFRICLRICISYSFFTHTVLQKVQVKSLSPHLCNPFCYKSLLVALVLGYQNLDYEYKIKTKILWMHLVPRDDLMAPSNQNKKQKKETCTEKYSIKNK